MQVSVDANASLALIGLISHQITLVEAVAVLGIAWGTTLTKTLRK